MYHSGVDADANLDRQVDDFLEKSQEDFFPKDLLCERLEENLLDIGCNNSFNVGNRLEGLENRDGTRQLFFPVGKDINRVGSCFLSSKSYAEKDCSKEKIKIPVSLSLPISQSILQNDDILLTSVGVQNFNHSTSHVVWNPHLPGEAVVVLENGEVNIIDIDHDGHFSVSCTFRSRDHRAAEAIKYCCNKPSHKRKRKFREPRVETSLYKWWSCEYGWHPRTILIAGEMGIDLIDLRQKVESRLLQCGLATIQNSTHLFSYCKGLSRNEHFTALAKVAYEDIFHFVASSTNHLMLYDVRQPRIPLLQWEHRMQLAPSRLLEIPSFSSTTSNLWNPVDKHLKGGKVIIACAFKSGEVQAFIYGPQPEIHSQTTESPIGVLGISPKLFSWGYPIKLNSQKYQFHKNIEYAFQPHGNNLSTPLSKYCGAEQLAGIISFSSLEPSALDLLQLRGSGNIVAQKLHFSSEQASNEQRSLFLPRRELPNRSNLGKHGTKHYRMEYFPALLSYMLDEGEISKFKQSDYLVRGADYGPGFHDQIDITVGSRKDAWREQNGHSLPPREHDITSTHSQSNGTRDPITAKVDAVQSQMRKLENEGVQSAEAFFQEMESQANPAKLLFEGPGPYLQPDEQKFLNGLRGLLQQWEHSFRPYAGFSVSNVEKAEVSP
ncbi:hypothetical protein KP509_17G033600 [Ceratopteris richardii]|nr:hypothetical protein KP509_17G033600 [Ceratopteris richardii]KAH7373026.1 hypothetical protein KP509_17G033600 [Ceratopteris richardii]